MKDGNRLPQPKIATGCSYRYVTGYLKIGNRLPQLKVEKLLKALFDALKMFNDLWHE